MKVVAAAVAATVLIAGMISGCGDATTWLTDNCECAECSECSVPEKTVIPKTGIECFANEVAMFDAPTKKFYCLNNLDIPCHTGQIMWDRAGTLFQCNDDRRWTSTGKRLDFSK
jgi:hypothetical protein